MANLQSTNVTGTLCVNGVAIGGGKDFKFACFTASDSWTPTSGLVTGDGVLDTFLLGGGGGGARCCVAQSQNCGPGGPGGSGGVGTQFFINMTSSNDACTITIGAGGAGKDDTGEGSGCNGGDTIFNTASIAACGAAAFGGGGGSNQWGNGGGIGIGRSYRRTPNDQANYPAGAGMGSYATGIAAAQRTMAGTGTSRKPCANLTSQFHFTGFGAAGASAPQDTAAIGRPGQGIKTALGWVGVPGYGHCAGSAMSQPAQICGTGINAQGYGNGGNGSCATAAGSGSSGLVILQWAE